MGSSITEIPEKLLEKEGNTTQFNMKDLKSALYEKQAKLAKLQKDGATDKQIHYVLGQIELLKDIIRSHGFYVSGGTRRRRAKKQRRRRMTQRKRRS
jgi:hypothetical protein